MMTPQPDETTSENPGAELLESRMNWAEGLLRARIQKLEAHVAHQDELMVQRLARLAIIDYKGRKLIYPQELYQPFLDEILAAQKPRPKLKSSTKKPKASAA